MAKAATKTRNKQETPEAELPVTESLVPEEGAVKKGKKKERRPRKKRKGKLFVVLTVLIVVLLLAALAFVAVYFNLFNTRHKIIDFVNRLDPAYAANVRSFDMLYEWEGTLNEKDLFLKDEEDRLNTERIALEKRETELLAKEQNAVPKYKQLLSDEDTEKYKNISKTYAIMDAEEAANILSSLYNLEDMATIIYFMNPAPAARILESMDQRLAAQITEELLEG